MEDLIATERSNIVAIADAVRNRTGESGDLTIGEIINGINGIEGGENLDAEIAAQNAIVAEQDAKIAELAEILAGKASGGGKELKCAYIFSTNYLEAENIVFEDGWTWGDFINSKYNTVMVGSNTYLSPRFSIKMDKFIIKNPNGLIYVSTDGTDNGRVLYSDLIIESKDYLLFDDD